MKKITCPGSQGPTRQTKRKSKHRSCNASMSWLNHYPGLAKVLAKLPARNIQFQRPHHWFNAMPNPTLPSYHMQLIVVWNLNARKALDSANKNWFQLLNRDIPEAHWLPLDPPKSVTLSRRKSAAARVCCKCLMVFHSQVCEV
eukprot:369189-Pelagomonas_calceolata.AAC.2